MEKTKQEILNCATDCIARNVELDKELGFIHDAALRNNRKPHTHHTVLEIPRRHSWADRLES